MITIENLKKMPLADLISYKNALEGLVEHYRTTVIPYYNKGVMYDSFTPAQRLSAEKITKANNYLGIIITVIEEKVYNALDNYGTEVNQETVAEVNLKTSETKNITRRKRKTNVKKDNQ